MYQRIVLAGHLGSDPELRNLPDGKPVTSFSLATNRKWKGDGGKQQEEVTWWHISVFGPQAEACAQYLSKGRQALVEGRMRPDPKTGGPRTWTRKDGGVGTGYDVSASSVRFLGTRGEGGAEAPVAATVDAQGVPF